MWKPAILASVGGLVDELPLSSIATDTPTGADLHAGAKLVLESIGKGDLAVITLADVSSTETIFLATKLNGDGIVPADSAEDDDMRQVIGATLVRGSATSSRAMQRSRRRSRR
jgi:hypothetical protein